MGEDGRRDKNNKHKKEIKEWGEGRGNIQKAVLLSIPMKIADTTIYSNPMRF